MNHFNSKRFRKKNENARGVFWIMVSRSLDVSLHFNENLTISGFLYIFWKFVKINENRLFKHVWTFFFKSISKLLQFGTGFWSFLDVSEHFNKSAHFLIIRNRYNPVNIFQTFTTVQSITMSYCGNIWTFLGPPQAKKKTEIECLLSKIRMKSDHFRGIFEKIAPCGRCGAVGPWSDPGPDRT